MTSLGILDKFRKKDSTEDGVLTYREVVSKTAIQMDELKAKGLHPKYLVLGYKNYIELMLYISRAVMERPHTLREWMGCQIVVVRDCDTIEVVPDVVDFVGFRSS